MNKNILTLSLALLVATMGISYANPETTSTGANAQYMIANPNYFMQNGNQPPRFDSNGTLIMSQPIKKVNKEPEIKDIPEPPTNLENSYKKPPQKPQSSYWDFNK